MDLNGAVALVTGGNGGLGQRICHALAQEGAHIAVMYARSREQAESVASELTSRHQVNARAFACDLTDDGAVDRLVGEVTEAFGRLDVLFNNAGISAGGALLEDLSYEQWQAVVDTNLTGAFLCTHTIDARHWRTSSSMSTVGMRA